MGSLLDTIAVQKFELTVPTTKKKIQYRAFIVKEEKILLVASESKNEQDMFNAMKTVVSACTFGEVDVENAPLIDIEYVFLKIRSRSVGEKAEPMVKCSKCSKYTAVSVDLSKIEPLHDPTHTSKVNLSSGVVVEMRCPRFKDVHRLEGVDNELDKAIGLVVACIDKVHSKNEVFNHKEVPLEDLETFVWSMTQEELKKLTAFLNTMPKLTTTVPFTCSGCSHQETVKLEGIRDFF